MFSQGDEKLTIPKFFEGKSVFVTGGSGFIGKVLIEKLLRSCPEIKNIYILIREKKGKTVQERIDDMINIPLFDKLKEQDEHALKKIIPILGNTMKLKLGINDEDRNTLISNVNIVYNCSASVRFDDHLKDAIFANVRSVRELVDMVKQFKHLNVLVHISTTYCNVDKEVVEEKIYPALSDWREAITIAENLDDDVMETFTRKYIHPFPNTYTYTKLLAEHTVQDLCKDVIPVAIVRPSTVIGSLREPIPGWIDTLNGPVTLINLSLKGIAKHIYVKSEKVLDMVYVDNVVKSVIIASWKLANSKLNKSEVKVYQACSELPWTFKKFGIYGRIIAWKNPSINRIWYAGNISLGSCELKYYLYTILYGIIPAIFLDGIFKAVGRKPIFLKIQRKLYIAQMALFYFGANDWQFLNNNYKELEDSLLDSDIPAFQFFSLCPKFQKEMHDYICKIAIPMGGKYVFQEVPNEQTFRNTFRLYILDRTVKLIWYGFIAYCLFWKYDILSIAGRKKYDYFENREA